METTRQDPGEIVELYGDMVYRICYVRLHGFCMTAVDDAFQEVFLRYMERAPRFQSAEHEKELRTDLLDIVGDNYLIVIQLDLPLKAFVLVRDLREIEYSPEIQRVIGIYVDVEERLAVVVEDLAVEFKILLLRAVGRVLHPQRMGIVYRLGRFRLLCIVSILLLRLRLLFALVVYFNRH